MTEAEWNASDDPAAMLGLFAPSLVQVPSLGSHETPARFTISDRRLRLFAVACCRAVWHLLTDPRSRNAVEVAERFADGLATEEEFTSAQDAVSELLTDPPGSPQRYAELMARCTLMSPEQAARTAADFGKTSGINMPSAVASLLREIAGNPFRPVTLPWAADMREYDHYQTAATMSPGPVRAVMYSCPWLTADVRSIAEVAYEDRPGGACGWCEGTGRDRPVPGDPWPLAVVPVCRRCKGTRRNGDGRLDNLRLAVLADALEEAGCAGGWGTVMVRQTPRSVGHIEHRYTTHPLVEHLRSPGPHVRGCWALDLILGKN